MINNIEYLVFQYGSLINSQHSICQDLGITFEFDDFCLLGVRFSKHLETIADDNYVGKVEEIRKNC